MRDASGPFHAGDADDQRRPATANQSRYVTAELAGAGSYMIAVGHLVEGPFDAAAFERACEALVQRHDALRTRFEIEAGAVHAVVAGAAARRVHLNALPDEGFDAFRSWALPLIFAEVDPLKAGSLIRFCAADYGGGWRFTIAAHHAISDGFSRGVMTKELLKLYAGEDLAPTPSYYDFPEAGNASPEAVEAYIETLPQPARIVGDGAQDEDDDPAGQFVERRFPELSSPLRRMSKSIGATRFGVLAASYALGLSGYAGAREVSSFFQTEGRRGVGAPNGVVGPFTNTLPLDLTVPPDSTFAAFSLAVSASAKAAAALETAPMLETAYAAGKAPSVSINTYPPAPPIRIEGLNVGPREMFDRRTEYDLNLVWSEDRGVMTARAFFDPAQISRDRAGLFLDHQAALLAAIIADPNRRCSEILGAARAGREAMIPQRTLDPEPKRRLHESFFDWAKQTPEAPAIVTSKGEISYRDLANRALSVTGGVLAAGVGEGDCVAIYAARDPRLIEAILGVSAAGASFAVIDATYPAARVRHMLDRLDARFVVEAGAELPSEFSPHVSRISAASDASAAPAAGPPRAAAYHMFTSGTTGLPKLVTHPDATVQRFVAWQHETVAEGLPPRTMMMAGLAHDPTPRDIFLALSHGGAVAVPTPCEMADPKRLRGLMTSARCSVLRFSAASARLLTAGAEGGAVFPDLKAIFWGGERLPKANPARWRALAPGARQFNVMGTTETPQAYVVHEITEDTPGRRDVPIGKPLPWTGVRIVDEDGAPVSTGEVGEIVTELADPVIGAKDPAQSDETRGALRHFTGDLGYQLSDGDIYFAGRWDGQIKINGHRVELGELEAIADRVEGVEQAIALLVDEKLRLYVLSPNRAAREQAVRAALESNLPAYMIPARIFVLDRFPATPNGKIDRPALASMTAEDRDAERSAPRGGGEEAVARIFATHSGVSAVSREDCLADLGADSLSTIEARLALEANGVDLPDDWRFATVAELAGLIPEQQNARPPFWRRMFEFSRIDTFLAMRALAIIAIVSQHSGFKFHGGGASMALFALAGFSFCRLQIPAIIAADHAGRVWALLARLLIVLIPASLVYFAVYDFELDPLKASYLLFYRNFMELVAVFALDQKPPWIPLVEFWFLHAYIQIFLVLGLLLSAPRVRKFTADNPWRAAVGFFLVAEIVGVWSIIALSWSRLDLVEAAYLMRSSPTSVLPFLAIGAVAALADTMRRRLALVCFGALHLYTAHILYVRNDEALWAIMLGLSFAAPFLKMPAFLARAVLVIAAHSLMIYLTHSFARKVFAKIFGEPDLVIYVIVFQILFGIAVGMAARPIIERLGVNRLANEGLASVLRR